MTTLQLKYFITVCKLGTVTMAAEKLQVTQPTISEAIRKLEKEMNCTLMTQMGRKLVLTPAGQLFLEQAEELLEHHEKVVDTMQNYRPGKEILRIGVTNMTPYHFVPKIYEKSKNAEFELILTERDTQKIVDMLMIGSIDAALLNESTLNSPNNDFAKNIEYRKIPQYKTYCTFCIHEKYRLTDAERIEWTDLTDIPLAISEGALNVKAYLDHMRWDGVTPHIVLQTRQIRTLREFVIDGLAGAFLSKDLFTNYPDVKSYYIPGREPSTTMCLMWKKGRPFEGTVKAFYKLVKAE